jgi:ribosomal protein L22
MYAVVGTWTMDPGRSAEQRHVLEARIVPSARQVAGFVSGYWTSAGEGGRSYSFILFDGEEAARAFKKSVESNTENQAKVGIDRNDLAVVEIVAQAESPTGSAARAR